jgi:very-short-patch-repair endonuclease
VVSRDQLAELGYTRSAIRSRLSNGRLREIHRGVYAVGTPVCTQLGLWVGAQLASGAGSGLSHQSSAEHWGIRNLGNGPIELFSTGQRRVPGLTVHRRPSLKAQHVRRKQGIRLTSLVVTIIDLAPRLPGSEVEAMIGEADRLGLIDPEELRDELSSYRGWKGVAKVRQLLDRRSYVLTHTWLERLFLQLLVEAGLPLPQGQARRGKSRVDFHWDDLGLVVETDGLTYHRTAAKQSEDLRRDHAHLAAGRTPLRFSHAQIRYEADYVRDQIAAVAARLVKKRT